jgi:cobalt-zinc-cadmium efflux system membrane fusion protein
MNRFSFTAPFLVAASLLITSLGWSANLSASDNHDHHDEGHEEQPTSVTMSTRVAPASDLTTAIASDGVLQERIKLYGTIVADPLRISHIQARYPGLIRSVKPTIGTRVKAGEVLATVESNESLREYPLLAPIDGVVVERHSNPGESTADRILFTLLDARVLELHLQVFPTDAGKIKTGQAITINANGQQGQTQVEYITPRHGETPTLEVHAPVDNSAGNWVPNQAVEGWVDIAHTPVALLVDNRALQSVRDQQVVFVQVKSRTQGAITYEMRPLELGRSDGRFTEVLNGPDAGGLKAGDKYVVENSFLLKSDLEKSGAAHEH